MSKIIPFRGVLYNKEKLADIAKVFAPPYDTISEEDEKRLYRGHRYNIVRLILGRRYPGDGSADNRYTRAAKFLNNWVKRGILVRDPAPSFYVYAHNYAYDGKARARIGFIGLLKLRDNPQGAVFLHERTYKKPKLDRLNLIRATRANLCSIFSLFIDKENKVTGILKNQVRNKPIFDVANSGGVRHRLWRLSEPRLVRRIENTMRDRDIFIADGHHRYEVALEYARERGQNYVMMYFLNLMDKDLLILPTHRLLKNLPRLKTDLEVMNKFGGYFAVERVRSQNALFANMHRPANLRRFGLFLRQDRYYLLALKKGSRELDVTILHNLIFKKILKTGPHYYGRDVSYTHDTRAAVAQVKAGRYDAAFFLNPTNIEEIRKVASQGARMPHKSTYFYPKLLSGIVINKFED